MQLNRPVSKTSEGAHALKGMALSRTRDSDTFVVFTLPAFELAVACAQKKCP
jgi:hypothetical protein